MSSKKKTGEKGSGAGQPEVREPEAKEPEQSESGVTISHAQIGQIRQMLGPILQPHVQYSGDPLQMANSVIGNNQQAAGSIMGLLQQIERGQ